MSDTDTGNSQITDAKKRYSAGVLRYKQMGYWDPDYQPKETDLIAMFRMTPQEALMGTTAHAARALGLTDRGRIAAGQRADLAVWDATHPAELSYRIGATRLHSRIIGGHLDA